MRTAKAIDPSSRTLLVEIDVDNKDGKLMPGAYTEVHMNVHSGVAPLIIPVSALIFRTQGLQVGTVVKGPDGDEARIVNVTLGQDDGSTVQVIQGLDGNSQVIQNPPDSLIDKEPVHVVQPVKNVRAGLNEVEGHSFRSTVGAYRCTVGPNYHRPDAPTAPAFKESSVPPPNPQGGGWKQATPNDSALKPNWWEIYQDPQLDKLEQQVAVSNQTLKAAYEQYMQARAAIQVARSQYFPHPVDCPDRIAQPPVTKPRAVRARQQDELQRLHIAGPGFLGTGSLGKHSPPGRSPARDDAGFGRRLGERRSEPALRARD